MNRIAEALMRRRRSRRSSILNCLDYLASHRELAAILASCDPDDEFSPRCEELVEAQMKWETEHEDHPFVRLAREAPSLDLAMLHVLIKDRLVSGDSAVGYPAHGLVREAISVGPGTDDLSPVVQGLSRLLDEDSPLVRVGFVDVARDGRPVDRRVTPTISLLRIAMREHLAGDPVEYVCGASRHTSPFDFDEQSERHGHSISVPRLPLVSLDDLVVTCEVRAAIDMVLAQFRHADVFQGWFAEAGGTYYTGLAPVAAFVGSPGTGKSAAAEAVATAAGLRVIEITASDILSKYVGEAERRVADVFENARETGALLILQEADGLLGARSRSAPSWERSRVTEFLVRLERHAGPVILTSNCADALDPAVERRVGLRVLFRRPDRRCRRLLWEKLLPTTLPLGEIDLDLLAETDLTGGEIRNAVLSASRSVLAGHGEEARITTADLRMAAEREKSSRFAEQAARDSIGFGVRR